jgi:carboxypeptidase family protein
MKLTTLCAVVFLLLAKPAFTQTTFGSITGTVTDPTGAVIPEASVSVTNQLTGIERKVTTSATGVFNVPNLDIGTYRVIVTASGFARYERPDLVLNSNQILNVDARLELATTATVTEVRGAMAAISTETSSLTDVKTNAVMEQLPLQMSRHLADKGFYTYSFLNTGVSSVTYTSLPVMNGVRNESGVLPTMDGIAVTAYSGGASPVQPSLEGVQEVNIVTNNPPAEFAVAANYTVVTKSGTNELHGSAFYNYNGNSLNARNFFSPSVPFRVYNNFGGGVGGPIKKNKLFFFGDFEGSREAAKNLMTVDTPLPTWRNGDFRSLDFAIVDPLNGIPFKDNIIPPQRISEVSKKIQDTLFPQPNFGPPGLEAANYRKEFPGTTGFTRFNQFDIRGDYNFSSRDVVFARVSWRRMPLDYTDLVPTIGKVTQRRYGHSAVASWNHTFSPAVLNEFRTGVTYHRNSYYLDVVGSDLVQQWGILGTTATGIHDAPIVRIDPVTYVDYDDFDDSYYNNPSATFQWIDNLSWTHGRHFVKFGVDVIRDRLNETIITSLIYGGYNFTGVWSGFGYADFLLGIPQTTELAVPPPARKLRATTTGLYVQDQFKVNRKLTLNYGLRWELMRPFSHTNGAIYSFDPKTGALVIPDKGASQINPYFPTDIPIETASEAGYPANSLLDAHNGYLQPRFGFAYKPFDSGNTVLRGGYGVYGNLVYRPIVRTMGGGPFAGSATFINEIADGVPLFQFPQPFLPSAIGAAGTQNVQGKNPHMKLPYTQQWNLTLEQQIREVGFRISYVGSRSVSLIYNRNLNEPPPSTTPFSASLRPYPLYNQVIWSDNGGSEFYSGLEVAASKKQGKNLTFGAGWTWARDLTDTQDSGGGGSSYGGQVIQNQFDRRVERANNALVLRQRAFGYAIYMLPFGRGQRFLATAHPVVDAVLGGWQTSWSVNLQSGQKFTPSFSGFDPSNTRTFGGRPDRIGDGNLPTGQRTIERWFDAAAFKIPGCPDDNPVCQDPANVGRFGNSGLNILEGPGVANLDFALMKGFHIKEKSRLQLMVNMVNALNHPNFAVPRANISQRGNVGKITSMARVLNGLPAVRQVDLGLRLEF